MPKHNPQHEIPLAPTRTRSGPFDLGLLRSTQNHWDICGLYLFLAPLIGRDAAIALLLNYNIGVSRWLGGSTIFFLADSGHPSDGFLGAYLFNIDHTTGRSALPIYTTVHDRLWDLYGVDAGKLPQPQPLIGTHLVHKDPSNPVIITRHPSIAILLSHVLPDYTVLAVGELDFIDLNCPAYIPALPTRQPIIMLAEPGDEEEWHSMMPHLISCVSHRGQSIHYLAISSLPGYAGDSARTILNHPEQVKALIENLIVCKAI